MQLTRCRMWSLKLTDTCGKGHSKLALFCLLLFVTNLETEGMAQQQVVQDVETRNHVFANKLYQVVAEDNTKDKLTNLIFSPLSLEIVLAVAGLGARGNTSTQISNGIGLSLEVSTLRSRFAPILSGIEDGSGCILRIATQIFVEHGYPLVEDFVNAAADGFSCGTQLVKFVQQPEAALKTINTWAENKTEGLIKDLLSEDAISADTRVILTNAVYFKGKWALPFDPTRTRKQKFYLAEGNEVDVDMMHIEKRFNFGHPDGLNAKVLELPYEGGQLSMVILLPDESSSIAELEGKVSAEAFDLDGLLSNHTRTVEVTVALPKFKIELTSKLESSLIKLGMSDMFTDHADFSGMTTSPTGLKVSKVIQKAFIEVSEEGTEAAAATGMIMMTRMALLPKPAFKANRPFIFILREKYSGIGLFLGRISNPTA